TRPEPALGDLEAPTLPEQNVFDGHTNVLEHDLSSAIGHTVVAQHGQRTQHPDSRRVFWHENHRLLAVLIWIARIGLAHEDSDLACHNGQAPPCCRCPAPSS